jgi:hypothetical protein
MRDRSIGALDTGCSRGEMLLIRNRHVEWESHVISIPAEHAKMERHDESDFGAPAGWPKY